MICSCNHSANNASSIPEEPVTTEVPNVDCDITAVCALISNMTESGTIEVIGIIDDEDFRLIIQALNNLYANNSNIKVNLDMSKSKGIEKIPDQAFFDARCVTEIKLPQELKTIGNNAFWYCPLEDITISNSVTKIENGAFCFCQFETLTIPANVEEIELGATFGGCYNLKTINVNVNNTHYKSVDGILFSKDGKTLLCCPAGKEETEYVVPSSVETIAEFSFSGCEKIGTIKVQNGTKIIKRGVFGGYGFSTVIILPKSLEYIEDIFDHDFTGHVYYEGSEAEWNSLIENIENYSFPSNSEITFNYSE